MKLARLAAAACAAAGAVSAVAPGARADNFVLQPGHALRVGTTQEIIGRDGDDLFVGMLGYNGHISPSSLWLRQNAILLAVGTNPSGPLGSAPGAANVLFSTAPSPPAFGGLPLFTIDGSARVGLDRVDLVLAPDRTLRVFVNGTTSSPYVSTILSGPTGLAVGGSPIGNMSSTDLRVGNVSTGSAIAYQAQQAALPPADVVRRAEQDAEATVGWCADFPDPYDYLNLLYQDGHRPSERAAVRKRYRVVYGELGADLRKVRAALGLDDYKGAHAEASRLRALDRQLKAADAKVKKVFKNSRARKKLLGKTSRVEAGVESTVKQLELM